MLARRQPDHVHGTANLHLDPTDLHLQWVVIARRVVGVSDGDLATAPLGKQRVVDCAFDLGAGLGQAPSEGYMKSVRVVAIPRIQSGLVEDIKGSIGEFEKPWELNA